MWVGFMTLEYVDYISWALNKVRIYIYYLYIHVELGNLGGVILLALCAIIIVHPGNVCRKRCSSQYYSLNILFMASLTLKIPTLFTIFLIFILALSLFIMTSIASYIVSFFP